MPNSAIFEFNPHEPQPQTPTQQILYVKRRTVSQMYRKKAGNPSTPVLQNAGPLQKTPCFQYKTAFYIFLTAYRDCDRLSPSLPNL